MSSKNKQSEKREKENLARKFLILKAKISEAVFSRPLLNFAQKTNVTWDAVTVSICYSLKEHLTSDSCVRKGKKKICALICEKRKKFSYEFSHRRGGIFSIFAFSNHFLWPKCGWLWRTQRVQTSFSDKINNVTLTCLRKNISLVFYSKCRTWGETKEKKKCTRTINM